MARCDLLPEDCIADHIAPHLDARRGTGNQWSARCPAHPHDTHRSLSLKVGTRGQRIIWKCHADCAPSDVRRAMLLLKISASCIPWRPDRDSAPEPIRRDRELEALAEIEEIILSEDAPNPQRMRLLIGMALWDCGKQEAAAKLGISRATMYRVSPVRQNRRKPGSHA